MSLQDINKHEDMFGGVEKVVKASVLFVFIIVVSAPCVYSCTSPYRPLYLWEPCVEGLCFNGDCVFGVCLCDTGWAGETCHQCCDLSCPAGQICGIDTLTGDEICTNEANFTTETGAGSPDDFPTTGSTDHQTFSEVTLTTTTLEPIYCNGNTWDLNVTQCAFIFDCYHGNCEKTAEDTYRCVCDPGWVTDHCDVCCDWECNGAGNCIAYKLEGDDVIRQCDCSDGNFTSESNCTERVETPTPEKHTPVWLWYVVGGAVVLSVVLVVVIIVIPVQLWKNRSILILKIVYYWQKFEDPDRPFHVFVSYCPEDERFVIRELVPKLENEMQLKVCVLARNAAPGAPISETIISAVKNSSRTILVVSPEYCQGDWAPFEYQVAQAEMSQLRHKIVPIVLKDSSDVTMDGLLEFILKSAKTLRWPEDERQSGDLWRKHMDIFWTRLRLQMPKIKRKSTPTDEKPSDDAPMRNIPLEHKLDIPNMQVETKPIDDNKVLEDDMKYSDTCNSLDSGYTSFGSSTSKL